MSMSNPITIKVIPVALASCVMVGFGFLPFPSLPHANSS